MYGIIHKEIFDSTVMAEGGDVVYVLMSLVALGDENDCVRMTPSTLADRIKKPLGDVEYALDRLNKEDPESDSPDYNGRRIVPIKEISELEGNRGWFVVNRLKYIDMVKKESRRRTNARHYRKTRIMSENPENNPHKVLISKESDPCKIYIDIDIDIDIDLWKEWMLIRRKKNAVNSNTALKALINRLVDIEHEGIYTGNFAMRTAIENSWKSVKTEWLDNLNEKNIENSGRSKKATGADISANDLDKL